MSSPPPRTAIVKRVTSPPRTLVPRACIALPPLSELHEADKESPENETPPTTLFHPIEAELGVAVTDEAIPAQVPVFFFEQTVSRVFGNHPGIGIQQMRAA